MGVSVICRSRFQRAATASSPRVEVPVRGKIDVLGHMRRTRPHLRLTKCWPGTYGRSPRLWWCRSDPDRLVWALFGSGGVGRVLTAVLHVTRCAYLTGAMGRCRRMH
jgi:hypothetical protein